MAQLTPWLIHKFYDTDGVTPLAGGKVFTYVAGGSTKKATYTTEAGDVEQTNPIVLNANGEPTTGEIWLGTGSYKIVIAPATDTDPPASPIKTINSVNNSRAYGTVSSVAELRDLDGNSFDTVNMLGYYVDGDGGGGILYWDATNSTADNGGTIFTPDNSAGNGRWVRSYVGMIDPRYFGAKGDGSTNDLASIQATVTWAASNEDDIVFTYNSVVGSGQHVINSNLAITAGVKVVMKPNATFAGSGGTRTITFNGPFEAVRNLVFDSTITAVFANSSISEAYPEWYAENTTPGTTDMAAAIKTALGTGKCSLGKNTYLAASTIEIGTGSGTVSEPETGETLELAHGCTLTGSVSPVVRLGGQNSTLRGNGWDSIITATVATGQGVVKVGHDDETGTEKVCYNNVSDIHIKGPDQFGSASAYHGDYTVGLMFFNSGPFGTGGICYYNYANNIRISDAKDGLVMTSTVNACHFHNLEFYRIGQTAIYAFSPFSTDSWGTRYGYDWDTQSVNSGGSECSISQVFVDTCFSAYDGGPAGTTYKARNFDDGQSYAQSGTCIRMDGHPKFLSFNAFLAEPKGSAGIEGTGYEISSDTLQCWIQGIFNMGGTSAGTNNSTSTSIMNLSGGEIKELTTRQHNTYSTQLMEAGTATDPSIYDRFSVDNSLSYINQSGNFTVGQVITGGTSGATGTISADVDSGSVGVLTLTDVAGVFTVGEIITDPVTGSAEVSFAANGTTGLYFPNPGEFEASIDGESSIHLENKKVSFFNATATRVFNVEGLPQAEGGGNMDVLARFLNNTDIYSNQPKAGIEFRGKINTAGANAFLGGVQAGKENVTDGNAAGFLAFYANPSAGAPVESARITSDSIFAKSYEAGITATNPGVQGDSPLTKNINEVATVGAGNDAVTMPSAFPGMEIVIINNGANTLEIWPASGDDLGAGVDTAVTLASGSNVRYVAYDATNWVSV